MEIVKVDAIPFAPKFAGEGFVSSLWRLTELDNAVVRLETLDGAVGWGEIGRPPPLAATMREFEAEELPNLPGNDLAGLPARLEEWRAAGKPGQCVAFGVELAMLDLIGRVCNMPVSAILGGPAAGDMPEYLSLSAGAPEEMAARARHEGAFFPVIQVKLGTDDLDTDLKRVRAVLDELGPAKKVLADFNGALAVDDAIRVLPLCTDPRLLWEEPCRTYDENLEATRQTGIGVMVDQCLVDLETNFRAVKDKMAAIAIKPDLLGGLGPARTVRDMCRAARIPMRIDGRWSGQIAGVGQLHLALGAPADLLLATIDLTEPIETGREMIRHPAPGRVGPYPGPGLGPVPGHVLTGNPK